MLLLMGPVLWLLSLSDGSAAAAEPARDTAQHSLVTEDEREHCRFPIRWQISLTGHVTLFFETGELVRIQGHLQKGVLRMVETDGLFVNARGESGGSVGDVGRVLLAVISSTEGALIFESGQHPFCHLTLTDPEPGVTVSATSSAERSR